MIFPRYSSMASSFEVSGSSRAFLRQMYAYLLQFEAQGAVLLYPAAGGLSQVEGMFRRSEFIAPGVSQHCALWFLDLFDKSNGLRLDVGEDLLNRLGAPSVAPILEDVS